MRTKAFPSSNVWIPFSNACLYLISLNSPQYMRFSKDLFLSLQFNLHPYKLIDQTIFIEMLMKKSY